MRIAPCIMGSVIVLATHVSAVGATPAKSRATYSDAATYCRAVGTIDYPDRQYRGPSTPAWIAEAVGSTKDNPGHVYWRCAQGAVLACVTRDMSGHGCEQMSADRKPWKGLWDFCRANPNADTIPFSVMGWQSAYLWYCAGTVPRANQRGMSLDRRGFTLDEWRVVRP